MGIYVKTIKTYAYVREFLSIFLIATMSALTAVLIANLFSGSLSTYRTWLEANMLVLSVLIFALLFTAWHKLMPTLRTFLKIKHGTGDGGILQKIKANRRLLILLTTSLLLFIFSVSDTAIFESINKHPARYGYLANAFLFMFILGLIAKISAPDKAVINDGVFVNDDPRDGDKLTESQTQAASYLEEILSNGMPRSVALTGDWGSGKTAVYHKARQEASKSHSDIIWVDFDPWRYASEEALVKGFYETIAKQIDVEIPGFQNAVRSMGKGVDQLISKKDTSGIFQAISGSVKDLASSESSPDGIIKGLLDREGRRLIVVLDDIERQYDAERTYRALQLVHHAKTMGKNNVQVLCIFEKATLLRAAPLHVPSSEEYLEKFSEIEISISPPNETSLRTHLEELINDPSHSKHLPSDFDLNLSPASVRDIKSHRGVVRAFNELLLEFISTNDRNQRLKEETDEDDAITYVNYSDRFLMGHLKLKYPSIFRDIAANRDRYTQPKEREDSIRNMLMDKEELSKKRREELEALFNEAHLNNEQKDTLKDLLVDLFPALSGILNQSNSHVPLPELRTERRVGHRDVLDAYFALTTSQDAYIQHEKWIEELLTDISDADDSELMRRFEKYTENARNDNSETDSITLLRNELLKENHKAYQLRAFRSWMRVVLKDAKAVADDDNRALARILSAINDIEQRSQPEDRVDIGKFVFHKVTDYISKPYIALLKCFLINIFG